MSRNALLTDTLREIRKSIARFLSILCIVGLGVAIFVGIKSAGPDMEVTADEYFDQQKMHDIQILSTMGLSSEDVVELAKLPFVESVFPSYSADAQVFVGTSSMVLKLHALKSAGSTVEMDEPVLVSGRLPEKAGECAVEQSVLDSLGLALGDSLQFDEGDGEMLVETNARIVGVVQSPLYISAERGTSSLGTGSADAFCYLPADAFDHSVYTEVNLRLRGAAELSCYSDAYEELVDQAVDELEEMAAEREASRLEDIKYRADNAVLLNEEQLNSTKTDTNEQIEEAKSELQDSLEELVDGEQELLEQEAQFRQQMQSAQQQLDEAQLQWNQADEELSAQEKVFYEETKPQTEAQLRQSKESLEAAELQLSQATESVRGFKTFFEERGNAPPFDSTQEIQQFQALLSGLMEAFPGQMPSEMEQLLAPELALVPPQLAQMALGQVDWLAQIRTMEQGLAESAAQIEQGWGQYYAGVQALQEGEGQLREARQQLDEGKITLDQQRKQLNESRGQGQAQLDAARQQLEEGWSLYRSGAAALLEQDAEATRSFTEAEKEIRSAYDQVDRLDEPVWYVLDRGGNYGYADFEQNTQRIAAIGQVFPALFFLVAALVSLTSMTRMVEEGRTQMGVLKALGYGQGSIAIKYLLYAAIASLVGSGIGMTMGFTLLPAVIYGAYQMMYTLPDVHLQFIWSYFLLAELAGLCCTAGAAYLAVRRQLWMTPARLMRPKMPKVGKRVLLEKIPWIWTRLGFTEKVTVRNLFRYKKRFFMTVFGIAGCTGLLLAGFGLRNSIMGMVGWQFGDVYQYQLSVVWTDEATNGQVQAIQSAVQRTGRLKGMAMTYTSAVTLWTDEEDKKDVTMIVAQDTQSFAQEVNLQTRGERIPVPLGDEGLVLTEKMSQILGVQAGDRVFVNLGEEGKDYSLLVTGVTENYVSHYIYLTKTGYERLLGKTFAANQALCSFTETDQDFENELAETLMGLDEVTSASFNSGLADYFDDMMASLDSVVLIIILSAGTLAFVVLYNLANINVTERERELATIKVLGFYDNEVTAYITRENVVLTLVGTAAGLALGVLLHRYIITTVEVDLVMFGRNIEFSSYVFSALLTFVFSALVNLVMHKKLKRINMIEALKSVE